MKTTKNGLLLAALVCPALLAMPSTTAVGPTYTGPLFDAHAHIVRSADMRPMALGELFGLLRQRQVDGVYLFGPSALTLEAHKSDRGYVFPFAEAPLDRQLKQLQFDDKTLATLEAQLKAGVMGIGEIPMRHMTTMQGAYKGYAVDGPIALGIYDLAARSGVPVNVHAEHAYSAELDRALAHNPKARIIWAHVGDGPPSLARSLLATHANLFADISTRNPYMKVKKPAREQELTNADGTIQAEWKAVFEQYPDRFLFGLDMNTPERVADVDKVIAYYRSVLGQLSPSTAERIAFRNAPAVLKR